MARKSFFVLVSVVTLLLAVFFMFGGGAYTQNVPYLKTQQKGVSVEEFNGIRFLRLHGRIQSAIDMNDPDKIIYPYAKMVSAAVMAFLYNEKTYPNRQKQRLLMIGLGGGTINRHVYKYFPQIKQTAVELDPEIARLAQEQFLPKNSSIEVVVADGRKYLQDHQQLFDIIVLDAFDGDYIPAPLMTLEFLKLAKSRLTSAGILIANTWFGHHLQQQESATYKEAFDKVFEMSYVSSKDDLTARSGNRILISSPLYPRMDLLRNDFDRVAKHLKITEYDIETMKYGLKELNFSKEAEVLKD